MIVVGELNMYRAAEALQGKLADVVYTQPPMGQASLRYWYGHARLKRSAPEWSDFLADMLRVIANCSKPDAHVFIEMREQWIDELADTARGVGMHESAGWPIRWVKGEDVRFLWYSGPGVPYLPTCNASELDITATMLAAVATPGALVFDPCCGKGLTARCAVRLGMRFAGVELNPHRAEYAQRWLERHA